MIMKKSMISNLKSNWSYFPFLLGLFICGFVAFAPDIGSALWKPEGVSWTPIHSLNYRVSDAYYYAAFVTEFLHNGFPIASPTAVELAEKLSPESLRGLPIIIAALPGLLIKDFRIVFLINSIMSGLTIFSAAYFITWFFTKNKWLAFTTGILTYFYASGWWLRIPYGPEGTDVVSWLQSIFWFIKYHLKTLLNIKDYDLLGDTWRYINLSITSPILLFYFLNVLVVYKYSYKIPSGFLFIFTPLMAFSYPSHAAIAYMLLVGFGTIALIRKEKKEAIIFGVTLIVSFLFLWIIRYQNMIELVYSSNPMIVDIFNKQSFEFLVLPVQGYLSILFLNKYFLTWVLALLLTRKSRYLFDSILVVGGIASLLACLRLFDMPEYIGRFLNRGIDMLWFTLFLTVLFNLWNDLQNWVKMKSLQTVLKACSFMFVAVICSFVLIGFTRYTIQSCTDTSRYIPQEVMDTYRWVDNHTPPNSNMIVTSWDDITLLPLYSKAKLVYGHSIIDGRDAKEELKRFIGAWKLLGMSENDFKVLVDQAPNAYLKWGNSISYINDRKIPYINKKEFFYSSFLQGLVYWPYVNAIEGMPVADYASRKTNPQFAEFALKLYRDTNIENYIQRYDVSYILVDKTENDYIKEVVTKKFAKVYENNIRVLYKTLP